MASGFQKLVEVFRADENADASVLKALVQQVRQRGIQIAYDAIEQKAKLGDTDVRIEVDGRNGVPIEAWRKRIRLSWGGGAQFAELVYFLFQQIQRATPAHTGKLAASWQWMLNGSVVSWSTVNTMAERGGLQKGDKLRLVNLQPYLRRADRLYVKRGIVQPVARAAKRKFHGFYIADDWITIPGHVFSRGIRKSRKGKGHSIDQKVPTILIMRASGLKDLASGPTLG